MSRDSASYCARQGDAIATVARPSGNPPPFRPWPHGRPPVERQPPKIGIAQSSVLPPKKPPNSGVGAPEPAGAGTAGAGFGAGFLALAFFFTVFFLAVFFMPFFLAGAAFFAFLDFFAFDFFAFFAMVSAPDWFNKNVPSNTRSAGLD